MTTPHYDLYIVDGEVVEQEIDLDYEAEQTWNNYEDDLYSI